jgi:hypothetical protein
VSKKPKEIAFILFLGKKNKAMTLTGDRFISSIGISTFKVKRLFSG